MNNARLEIPKDVLSVGCRLLLAITFIWACIYKIAYPYDFALQVATYQILPLSLVNLQAIILPWAELVVGVVLVVGWWTRGAALVTCGMNVMFITAIALALSADLQLQCGCFSSSEVGDQLNAGLIIRDIGLLLAGLFLVVIRPDRLTLDRWFERRSKHA
ncbi:MAG: MauE/DoxX family redox-associated membrane protein [Myxococcota bacterium]|nr:MauE/DoxX family redox-associated membrane protein [Myxococcota bacterium]